MEFPRWTVAMTARLPEIDRAGSRLRFLVLIVVSAIAMARAEKTVG